MTTTQTNTLIADFMGVLPGKGTFFIENPFTIESYGDVLDLKYDVSLDWLHTVVDRIEELGYNVSVKTYYVKIKPENDQYIIWVKRDGSIIRKVDYYNAVNEYFLYERLEPDSATATLKKIDMLYKAILEFIYYYNNQNLNQ